MILRALALSFRASFNKFINNYMKEVTVIICSLSICALFWYMFSDFVNEEIATISVKAQANISLVTSMVISLIGAKILGNFIRDERSDENSMKIFLKHLGHTNNEIRHYEQSRILVGVILYSVVFVSVTQKLLYLVEVSTIIALNLISIILSIVISKALSTKHDDSEKIRPIRAYKPTKNHLQLRFILYLSASRIGGFRIGLWALSALLAFPALMYASLKVSLFPLCFFALIVGSVHTMLFAELLSDDLNSCEFEKILGFKHDEMVKFYFLATLFNSLILALLAGVFELVIRISTQTPHSQHSTLLILFATMTPSLLFSSIAFQIDARKPFIQVAASLLISLFVVTAAYYNLIGWIVILPIFYYAKSYQHNRYYRA